MSAFANVDQAHTRPGVKASGRIGPAARARNRPHPISILWRKILYDNHENRSVPMAIEHVQAWIITTIVSAFWKINKRDTTGYRSFMFHVCIPILIHHHTNIHVIILHRICRIFMGYRYPPVTSNPFFSLIAIMHYRFLEQE
jgi:hypothetical protein